MTTDPIRALLLEMADELDHNRQCLMDDRRLTHPLADRARAALATAHLTYCWEVRTAEGEPCASGDAPTAEEAEREGRHYLARYQQDGPHRLRVWVEYSILEVSDD